METKRIPNPEITKDEPIAHGDLSVGIKVTLGRTPVHDPNPDNSLHRIGPDNFRGWSDRITHKTPQRSA